MGAWDDDTEQWDLDSSDWDSPDTILFQGTLSTALSDAFLLGLDRPIYSQVSSGGSLATSVNLLIGTKFSGLVGSSSVATTTLLSSMKAALGLIHTVGPNMVRLWEPVPPVGGNWTPA